VWIQEAQFDMRENEKRLFKIFVVDDNTNHSAGIRQLIEMEPDMKVVGLATSGQEAIQKIAKVDADIILMDMNMPEMDGIATIEKIVELKPSIKILTLTGYDDPDLIFRAMQVGGKGYILKTMVTTQLRQAILDVCAGKVFLPVSLATKFFDEFQNKQTRSHAPDPVRAALLNYLTNREKEVLALLTEGITFKVVDQLGDKPCHFFIVAPVKRCPFNTLHQFFSPRHQSDNLNGNGFTVPRMEGPAPVIHPVGFQACRRPIQGGAKLVGQYYQKTSHVRVKARRFPQFVRIDIICQYFRQLLQRQARRYKIRVV